MANPLGSTHTAVGFIPSRRIFTDKDGKIVGEKDPTRITLVGVPGQIIPKVDAIRLGLMTEAGELTELAQIGLAAAEESAAEIDPADTNPNPLQAAAETKAVKSAPVTKDVKVPPKDKGTTTKKEE